MASGGGRRDRAGLGQDALKEVLDMVDETVDVRYMVDHVGIVVELFQPAGG